VIAIHLSRLRPLFNSSREDEPLPESETGEETDLSDSSETSDSDDLEHDVELSVCMKTCNKGNNLGSQGTLNFQNSLKCCPILSQARRHAIVRDT
jgi:hypothetical protein